MINGSITQRGGVSGGLTAGVGGTTDYNELENRPSINGNILEGNKNGHNLGLANLSDIPEIPNYQIVKDVLYDNPNGAPHLTWVELSKSITDYDIIYLKVSNPTDISGFNIYASVSFCPLLFNFNNEKLSIQALYGTRVVDVTFNENKFQIVRTDGDYRNSTIYKIIGVKLGVTA